MLRVFNNKGSQFNFLLAESSKRNVAGNSGRVVISIHPILLAVHPLDSAAPSFLIAAHPEM